MPRSRLFPHGKGAPAWIAFFGSALVALAILLTGLSGARAGDITPPPTVPRDVQPPPGGPNNEDAEPGIDLTGHWEGTIDLPGGGLQILLDFKKNDSNDWIGTIDIPMQGAKGLPVGEIVINGDRVDFILPGIPGDPKFKGRSRDKQIEGDFKQGGQTYPFAIGREAMPKPKRPQEPKPPFPYKAEDVTYQGGDVTFAGTITIPAGNGPFPAALLITGSGPQNRDEELFGHKPFAVLADFLSRAGIVVLRVDDRGVGGTTGQSPTVTTEDFANDAEAGVAYLRSRPEVDNKKVGLIGHSEGGLIGPMVASRSKNVAFVVMLAGTGVPGHDVILKQSELISRASGMREGVIRAEDAQMRVVLAQVEAGADTASIRNKLNETAVAQIAAAADSDKAGIEATARGIRAQVGALTSPWFRFFLTYDPRPALEKVKVPVLALNGERDLQVPPGLNLPEIEKALREGKNRDYTVKEMPGLNHLFQPAVTGGVMEYGSIEITMDPSVLETVRDWILKRFAES